MAEEIKAAEASSEEGKTATESKEKSEDSEHIDYKSQFEEEKARREKAEAVLRRLHDKGRDDNEDEEGQPDLSEQVRSILATELDERFGKLSSELRAEKLEALIAKSASDLEEAKLIRYHYDNSIRQSGDLVLDIENAKVLANKKRLESQVEEMKAAAVSKETASSGSGIGRKPTQQEESIKLTLVDEKIIEGLRQKYTLSNDAIRRLMKGETLGALIQQGVVKER